jgi:UDP-N-acetylglucosamine 2-epimerase (non-hydrolysing)
MDFMSVVLNARYVLTDSGGLQAETTWLGIPCLTLRDRTEHLLTVQQGTNCLCSLDLDRVREALDRACSFSRSHYRPPALWDGCAAPRIAKVLAGFLDGTQEDVATTLVNGKRQ